MKKSTSILLALLGLSALALSSCNTIAGAGQDIQKAGNAISNSASR
ncbi:entericidin A/B family lipoprotein [Verrucomicrobiaceae bacterium N1E253]|uniref:Entericidin A/B family lipoprotein n=1 Tax=Oceaniferula marina TaxID=2748318 RepID=A0A851GD50_9BACT|nr:entericidin A/B family lipoprotein [Oceaniferula marina]NWK55346.1 entericidin A/B family lipoprotein [Oceaniferula marina]